MVVVALFLHDVGGSLSEMLRQSRSMSGRVLREASQLESAPKNISGCNPSLGFLL